MTEEFLQYLWKNRLLNPNNLQTPNGEKIEIIHPGYLNTDSGPDFLNAKIRIGNTVWAGCVEIHLLASDWYAHRHNNDAAYDNVVLHVVWKNDKPVYRKNTKEPLPSLEIKDQFESSLFENYKKLLNAQNWIPCEASLSSVKPINRQSWIEACAAERLESKTTDVEKLLQENKNDWDEVLYIKIARYFGAKINTYPFELLAKSISLKTLSRYTSEKNKIEALLFGQAGLLERSFKDEYPNSLKTEYEHLRRKHSLTAIPAHLWKFFRTRPDNFPTLRIAQFAALVAKYPRIFSTILDSTNIDELYSIFRIEAGDYWNNHRVFDKETAKVAVRIGELLVSVIIINAVVPTLFAYGKYISDTSYCDKALDILTQMKPENNKIIQQWQKSGIKATNALETQGLLQLKENYCSRKQCLSCRIGYEILKMI